MVTLNCGELVDLLFCCSVVQVFATISENC